MKSSLGTELVLYNCNTFSPFNIFTDKKIPRNWMCSMNYVEDCLAQVTTHFEGNVEFIRASVTAHNHPKRIALTKFKFYSRGIFEFNNKHDLKKNVFVYFALTPRYFCIIDLYLMSIFANSF